MVKTLEEIAAFIGGEVIGDGHTPITGVAGIREAEKGDLTFIANPKYLAYLDKTNASAVITSPDIAAGSKPVIRVAHPSLAFVKAVSFILPSDIKRPQGVHPTAVLGKGARLGRGAAIGAYAVIEEGAVIGDETIIYPGCYIGFNSRIGSHTLLYPNVSICEDVTIGNRVIIHSGSVVGSDGFGFVTVDGAHHKIPQVGTVVIEDDVELGANVTIDRARFDKTVIGQGTKIDNLVQIAHNVTVGKNCLIVAQVGISGSTEVGNNVVLAGQVGVVGHIKIGDNAIVMAQAGVSKSVPENAIFWGYPARPQDAAKRANAALYNLPRLYETVRELKKKIEELEKKNANG